jgi:arylsulfatase
VQDLLPTLIELCGLEAIESPLTLNGTSLAGLLRGTTAELPDRKLVVQYRVSGEPWDPAVVMWGKWRLLKSKAGRKPQDPNAALELYHVGRDPGQQTNVAAQHPDIVEAMAAHYETWHSEARPLFDRERWITLGSEASDSTILYAQDWVGDYCDNPGGLRKGDAQGYWNVAVDRAGVYEVTLRRWPQESGKMLTEGWDGADDHGPTARPITAANLQIGQANHTLDAGGEADEVTFRVKMAAGKTQLRTHFLDAEDRALSSAFYTYVQWLGDSEDDLTPTSDRRPLARRPGAEAGIPVSARPLKLKPADLLIADFETEDHAGWKVQGTAFGDGPTPELRVATQSGKQVIDTFATGGGDAATGTLTSPPFRIERNFIHFLIGGGNHPDKTCVNLLVAGEVVRTAEGPAAKNPAGKKVMKRVSWDVKEWQGKDAQRSNPDGRSSFQGLGPHRRRPDRSIPSCRQVRSRFRGSD